MWQFGFLSKKGLLGAALWQEKADWGMCGIACAHRKGRWGRGGFPGPVLAGRTAAKAARLTLY